LHESLSNRMKSQVLLQESLGKGSGRQRNERRLRVVFATHLAEASVTLPHVRYVVDSGLARLSYFDYDAGLDRFFTVPISQAAAQQRASLAKRHRSHSGACFRLYAESYLEQMVSRTPPEIHRCNLTSFLLTLKAVGVDNILAFELMDSPSLKAVQNGLESLYALGAIDDKTRLTRMGLNMTSFPVDPRISRMLLQSLTEGCSWEVSAVASILHLNHELVSKPRGYTKTSTLRQQQLFEYDEAMAQFVDSSGDHVTFANIFAGSDDGGGWNATECKEKFVYFDALRRGLEWRNRLVRLLAKLGKVAAFGLRNGADGVGRSEAIRRCVISGFFANTAKLGADGAYYTMRKRILVTPSPNSLFTTHTHISSEYIVFASILDGARDGIELRFVSAVEAKWLRELAPHYWE
jgi:ATP-dependent RNA helicase DDX35